MKWAHQNVEPESATFQSLKSTESSAICHTRSREARPGAAHDVVKNLNGYCRESIGWECSVISGDIFGCRVALQRMLNRPSFLSDRS
jgi:hypothetical protein